MRLRLGRSRLGLLAAAAVALLTLVPSGALADATSAPPDPADAGFAWTEIASPSSLARSLVTNLAWNPAGFEMTVANPNGVLRTFGWIGGTWTDLGVRTPQAIPVGSLLVYDASDRTMLVVSTIAGVQSHARTWTFQHHLWSEVFAPGAPPEGVDYAPTLVYDASDGYVLFFGGSTTDRCDCPSSQTWSYHAGVWHRFSPPVRPIPVTNPELLFDPALGAVVLYQDGSNFAGTAFGFWTFHAGIWQRISPMPHPRLYGEVGYDAARSVYLATGFSTTGAGPYPWVWPAGAGGFANATRLTDHPHRLCLAPNGLYMNYDPALRGLFCLGTDRGVWTFT